MAQRVHDPALLLEAHHWLGATLFYLGELASAQAHLEQSLALYDYQQHRSLAFRYGYDPQVVCLGRVAWALGLLGYPDQALQRSQEALTLAQELAHPLGLGFALMLAAHVHQLRREGHLVQERAEAVITLSGEYGNVYGLAQGTIQRGWALAEQGQTEEGIAQMRQGQAALRAMGEKLGQSAYLAMLAEAYGKVGQAEEELTLLAEALAVVQENGERFREAELYRLKGTLTLQKFQVSGSEFQVPRSPESEVRSPEAEAEECFKKPSRLPASNKRSRWNCEQ